MSRANEKAKQEKQVPLLKEYLRGCIICLSHDDAKPVCPALQKQYNFAKDKRRRKIFNVA